MKKEADSRIDATPGEPRQQGWERDVVYVHRTISATAAQTTTHAWSVPQRHAARPRRLVGHSDRHVESGIDLQYCRDASQRERKNRGCCWAASGCREKILIKGSSMKGVLSKQHSLVVLLGGAAA